MNFSFAGCGFLGIYHVGVAACLKKYAPNLLVNKTSGASAGALAAVCLLCDSPLGTITSSILKTASEARKRALGPFSPTFNLEKLLREGLLSVLPEDAHKIVSGRLFISVTRVSDGKNILLSQFDTREELVQAVQCSCFVPGFSGWMPPTFRGVRYLDGFCSNNVPKLDDTTVSVSPFAGEHDICPRDREYISYTVNLANTSIELSKENLYRFARILFPPHPEVLSKMCQQGFNDALDYLQRSNLINCTRCLAVQSSFSVTDQDTQEQDHYEEHETALDMSHLDCDDCNRHRKEAILDQLPEAVGGILQDAINKANQGLMNWVFKHRSMKLLSVITLPYILPIDIAYSAFLKFIETAPTAKDIQSLGRQVIMLVKELIRTTSSKPSPPHHHHMDSSKFSCQLAITQFSDLPTLGKTAWTLIIVMEAVNQWKGRRGTARRIKRSRRKMAGCIKGSSSRKEISIYERKNVKRGDRKRQSEGVKRNVVNFERASLMEKRKMYKRGKQEKGKAKEGRILHQRKTRLRETYMKLRLENYLQKTEWKKTEEKCISTERAARLRRNAKQIQNKADNCKKDIKKETGCTRMQDLGSCMEMERDYVVREDLKYVKKKKVVREKCFDGGIMDRKRRRLEM